MNKRLKKRKVGIKMESMYLGRIGRKLWKNVYIKGILEHLEKEDKTLREVKVYKNRDENKVLEGILRDIVRDCKNIKYSRDYIRLYDGYLIRFNDDYWLKVLMIQNNFLGFVVYYSNNVYRYIVDKRTGYILKTGYTRGIIRGLN